MVLKVRVRHLAILGPKLPMICRTTIQLDARMTWLKIRLTGNRLGETAVVRILPAPHVFAAALIGSGLGSPYFGASTRLMVNFFNYYW